MPSNLPPKSRCGWYCVSAVLETESDASDASDSSDVSDTADTSDVTDTTDPSDSSETSDPTDPASGCADPLAVNQNTPDPCTYDDLSDGVSNAGFEIGCGEDGNRLDGWNTTSTDAEVFIATTGERFITAPASTMARHASAPSMVTTRHGSPIETTVSVRKAEFTKNAHSATFRHRRF